MSEHLTDDSDRWGFEVGDVIEQRDEFVTSVGGVDMPKQMYRVKRRLIDDSDGNRFYHVAVLHLTHSDEEVYGNHLYSAGVIEGTYRSLHTESDRP